MTKQINKLEGTDLTKALRQIVEFYNEIKEAVNNKPWTDVANNLSRVYLHLNYEILSETTVKVTYNTSKGSYFECAEHELTVFVHKYMGDFDGKTPDYSLVSTYDSMIDGDTYAIDWVVEKLGHDFTEKEQADFFRTWDLTPLERFMSKDLGCTIDLIKDITTKNKVCCYLHSYDLTEHSGICKAMFRTLTIESFGSCSFYIDKYTGLQQVSVPDMSFRYEHTGGGNNGHSIYYVSYNIRKGTWQIRKPDEDKAYNIDNDGNIIE